MAEPWIRSAVGSHWLWLDWESSPAVDVLMTTNKLPKESNRMSIVGKAAAAVSRLPGCSLLLAGAAGVLWCFPRALDVLQYDRGALAAGQFWRVVTCHLTHCSFDHLLWDAGVLLLLGWLCEQRDRRQWLFCVFLSAVTIPWAIWTLVPELRTYRGLSGVDSALFVMIAVTILSENLAARRTLQASATALVIIGFVAKTAFEVVTAQTVFVDSTAAAMVPVPLAHIVGGIVGLTSVWAVPALGQGQRAPSRLWKPPTAVKWSRIS